MSTIRGEVQTSALKSANIPAKKVPTTGQDATPDGMKNILQGYQCMSVYKPIYLEAQSAAAIALYLRAGQTPPTGLVNATTKDTQTNTDVKSSYLTPTWVTVANIEDTVVKDQAVKVTDICVADTQAACTANGIK